MCGPSFDFPSRTVEPSKPHLYGLDPTRAFKTVFLAAVGGLVATLGQWRRTKLDEGMIGMGMGVAVRSEDIDCT